MTSRTLLQVSNIIIVKYFFLLHNLENIFLDTEHRTDKLIQPAGERVTTGASTIRVSLVTTGVSTSKPTNSSSGYYGGSSNDYTEDTTAGFYYYIIKYFFYFTI